MSDTVMDEPRKIETRRQWISGLAITLTTIVSYFGFWRLSPGVTFVIACIALVSCLAFLWFAGREKQSGATPAIPPASS